MEAGAGLRLTALGGLVGIAFGLGVLAGFEWAPDGSPAGSGPVEPPEPRVDGEPSVPDDSPARPGWLARCPDAGGQQAALDGANKRIEELEARLALARVVEQGYRGELYGTPVPWPDEVPEQLRPEGFQALLAESLDACQVPAELVGFACEEAPCMAMLRPERRDWIWSLIRDCPSWGERFKQVPLQYDFWVECRGRSERVVLLAPFWKDFPGDREAMLKRLAARVEQIRSGWQCEP